MDEPGAVSVVANPSVHCLVAMVDIRGFSGFAYDENDPSAVAGYVRAATHHILARVRTCRLLADTTIKPLGDGLLFILDLEGETPSAMASSAEEMLRELVDVSNTFESYLNLHRPAGVVSPPSRLGIGVTYGPLVQLLVQSPRPTVEFENYVGHSINLAQRLQEVARRGGVLVHDDVYEKLLRHDVGRSSSFLSSFPQHVDIQLRSIGSLEHAWIYAPDTTEIPPEYLKSKAEEKTLEEFSQRARQELRVSYTNNRSPENHRMQVPETTRFILFRRDGEFFRETVSYMGGERITSQMQAAFRFDEVTEGRGPVTDAIATGRPVVVSYPVRYDECEDNIENEYWQQTRQRFPDAPVHALHDLAMHPSSILAIPLTDSHEGPVSAVAMFDNVEKGVFSDDLAAEMWIKLGVLYGQLFALPEADGPRVVQL